MGEGADRNPQLSGVIWALNQLLKAGAGQTEVINYLFRILGRGGAKILGGHCRGPPGPLYRPPWPLATINFHWVILIELLPLQPYSFIHLKSQIIKDNVD